jgi:hypothetical protein
MRSGQLVGELSRAEATAERVLKLMTGCGKEKELHPQILPDLAVS